ncbi:hypothetical protein BC940DRAFT_307681 [Gongronella butleri]|nr:hypothetical protein BC940DRAFT_307681 [Gongronella butleri]
MTATTPMRPSLKPSACTSPVVTSAQSCTACPLVLSTSLPISSKTMACLPSPTTPRPKKRAKCCPNGLTAMPRLLWPPVPLAQALTTLASVLCYTTRCRTA